jgi:predicted RNA binding protein YcfA (HicA-like mRNA interferase family)
MPKLKSLSAKKVISIFESLGFTIVSQKGSHIKLARETALGRQILTVPNHKEMDKGTLKGIYNQALRFVSESELRKHFYTD